VTQRDMLHRYPRTLGILTAGFRRTGIVRGIKEFRGVKGVAHLCGLHTVQQGRCCLGQSGQSLSTSEPAGTFPALIVLRLSSRRTTDFFIFSCDRGRRVRLPLKRQQLQVLEVCDDGLGVDVYVACRLKLSGQLPREFVAARLLTGLTLHTAEAAVNHLPTPSLPQHRHRHRHRHRRHRRRHHHPSSSWPDRVSLRGTARPR